MSGEETPIHCLPDEMLEKIFSTLSKEDRKSVSTVCRRWVPLALQWSTIQLNVDFRQESDFRYHALQESRRPYKYLQFYFGDDADNQDRILNSVEKFANSMQSLKLHLTGDEPFDMSFLAGLLRLSGNLKELFIIGGHFINDYVTMCADQPMENLNRLHLYVSDLPRVPVHDIAPNITALHIRIDSGSIESLSILDHFCSRLIELEVWCYEKIPVLSVCALDFPKLQKLTFFCANVNQKRGVVEKSIRFFRMCPLLQEATLTGDHFKQVLETLSESCPNLHYLHLQMKTVMKQDFICISSIKSLKTLKIQGAKKQVAKIKVPESCPILQSLESFILDYVYTGRNEFKLNDFLRDTYPALRTIKMIRVSPEGLYEPLHYFCGILSYLECLEQITLEHCGDMDMLQFLFYVEGSLPKLREVTFKVAQDYLTRVPMVKISSSLLTLIVEPDSKLSAKYLFDKIYCTFPDLKKLTVTELTEDSLKDIQHARQRMPECEIIVERLLPSQSVAKKSS